MRQPFFLALLVCSFITKAQNNPLEKFRPLVGKTWEADGKWGDGSSFKQSITFRFDLENTLVIASSKGFVDTNQKTIGNRNHGIRQYDKTSNSMRFWEFDVFGGVTEGTVEFEDKDIVYTYKYGESIVTDYWQYVDENTYNFTVGSRENGEWKQKYLETKFLAK